MVKLTILYWRDIPRQVIIKSNQGTAKRELPEKFQKAVDFGAMRTKALGTDDRLADWLRG